MYQCSETGEFKKSQGVRDPDLGLGYLHASNGHEDVSVSDSVFVFSVISQFLPWTKMYLEHISRLSIKGRFLTQFGGMWAGSRLQRSGNLLSLRWPEESCCPYGLCWAASRDFCSWQAQQGFLARAERAPALGCLPRWDAWRAEIPCLHPHLVGGSRCAARRGWQPARSWQPLARAPRTAPAPGCPGAGEGSAAVSPRVPGRRPSASVTGHGSSRRNAEQTQGSEVLPFKPHTFSLRAVWTAVMKGCAC